MPATSSAQRRIARLATLTAVHRAFRWLHLHQPQLRHWQIELVSVPAPPFGESARADWFLDRFRQLGLTNPHLDDAGNVLAELTCEPPTPHPASSSEGVISAEATDSLTVRREAERPTHLASTGNLSIESSTTPCILLSAHLDTVFPGNTPIEPTEEKTPPASTRPASATTAPASPPCSLSPLHYATPTSPLPSPSSSPPT